ncbi:hypothetical protein [Phocaeicola abscessus]|uniref:hypothetical protein n=1 Tax=Phocaeicola abscessus TaxID=555313 RepID=UPI0028EE673C|nr:hypothetical protein [Phocaeicola abscessus]
MNKKRTEPLIPPLSGRWARVGLSVLFSATVAVGTQAQTADRGGTQPPRDQNSELHTRTWSIYAQGGLSWANDVWYQNLDAKRSYQQSPTVGGGIDFTIRPWVRVGAEYLWSRYRREQWLNIWVGTGAGYTFAKGNEYGIYISNTQTQGGQTTPIGDGKITLDPEDDATTVNLGAEWSTPEIAQFVELYKYCKKEWKTIDGVQGRVYTGPNKNSIFLPFNGMADRKQKDDVGKQGYYWMKSHRGERYTFFFEFFSVTTLGEGERATFRHFGMGIRPVRK